MSADDHEKHSYLDVCQAHLIEKHFKEPKPEELRKPMFPLRLAQGLKRRAQCFVDNTQDPPAVRDKVPSIYQQHQARRMEDLSTLLAAQFKYPKAKAVDITKACIFSVWTADACSGVHVCCALPLRDPCMTCERMSGSC